MAYKLTENQIRTVVERGSKALADYCINGNLHYVVTGSSGGLDSAVTLAFAERACKLVKTKNHALISVALVMPCESDHEDTKKGLLAAQTFGAQTITSCLDPAFACFTEKIKKSLDDKIVEILTKPGGSNAIANWNWSERVAQGNIKARLRMITLYHAAKMLNGMVLSTDNLSEYWMGFWTICGDVGDFNIIQNIMKGRELYDIARFLGIPEEIVKAQPGDGLKVAGTAQTQLGADYPTIDTIMIQLIQYGFDPNGSNRQLENLPQLAGVDPISIEMVAGKCLRGTYKRRGTVTLSREYLGLPAIEDIEL